MEKPEGACVYRNARLADGSQATLSVQDGRFKSITPGAAIPEEAVAQIVDLGGRLVLPGLVDGHIHLDKSFVGDVWKPHRACADGFDVRERVAIEKELFTSAAPMHERAAALLRLCIAQGTTRMRSHVDIDVDVGLRHLETVLAARETFASLVEIQIVAFPQSGILAAPGTEELLDAAIVEGADLVGGLDPASFDRDVERHLDVVFGIAERRGVGVDIHLHDATRLGIFELEQIAERTRALGMQGKVAVSHAYALGEVDEGTMRRTAAQLAEAGVAIMTNAPGNHPFPPVLPLRQEGVTVFSGNDNIRDAWWPYGDGDMLRRANMIGYRSGFYTDDELEVALDLATDAAAEALGLDDYGLRVGARADFVTLKASHGAEAVASCPPRQDVYRAGRLVARDGYLVDRSGEA
ncbi:cytosine deaminase [Arboricoccus pini]|uniref:Cytosine deaminase n=1 Tax=Arboricoccus pini TaxID=1963835 RepID=A0A212RV99_9PROT|nr:amidohydrolase family protein [Arboricoccus pini]SNB76648.1 cytosine deaminase [Arboricoccus pini]